MPLALRAAEAGFEVVGYDVNDATVASLSAGRSHVDDISHCQLQAGLQRGYSITAGPSVIADAVIVVVCVPTPLADTGGPDLRAVEGSASTIGAHVRPETLVILESTTYPGTTEKSLRLSYSGTSPP